MTISAIGAFAQLRVYWYWRGVVDEIGDQRRLANLLHGAPQARGPVGKEIDLDLRDGLGAAERQLDEIRPMGVWIRFGPQPIGHIPAEPGAERLRGIHLRPFLAKELAQPLLTAIALERASDGSNRAGRLSGEHFTFGDPRA